MSFFQNIFRGGGQAVTGPEDTAPQSESSTASNAANSSADKAVKQGKKRGRPPGKRNKKTEGQIARQEGKNQKLAQKISTDALDTDASEGDSTALTSRRRPSLPAMFSTPTPQQEAAEVERLAEAVLGRGHNEDVLSTTMNADQWAKQQKKDDAHTKLDEHDEKLC